MHVFNRVSDPCTCCRGVGEHSDGHECYTCDAGMTRAAQMESTQGEYCEGHHGVPDDGPENAKIRYGSDFEHSDYWDEGVEASFASEFLETVARTYNASRARDFAGGYEGVTHAGLAIVALDTGNVLLAQRAADPTDAPDVAETWEFPGGSLDGDEEPLAAAIREYGEEVMLPLPVGMVVNGWRAGPEENYQGFVYTVDTEFDISGFVPNAETQAVAWVDLSDTDLPIRPEMEGFDVSLLDVSGNEEKMATDDLLDEPDLSWSDLAMGGVPIHGVLAPEDVETGDGRGFNAGSMTARPGILPFSWQKSAIGAHDGSVVTGGLTRMMRKDGLIHYEGMLMPTEEAGEFAGLLAFFGQFGVSVDGDNGNIDTAKTKASGVLWFDAVRASGLTAVAIPAFCEAYVAFGPHPDMPSDAVLTASMTASGDLVTFDRGPGWVTNPKETKRIHDYWTKKGQPGYAKIGWGTPGDFTRAKKLIGAKIAANSPEDMKYLNQIIAQWHHDALGYWPGELGKPGNAPDTPENRKRAARHAAASRGIEVKDDINDGWETVLVASAAGKKVRPPLHYFEKQEGSGSLYIADEPDENGFRQTWGYAGEFGVCHLGIDGECVEIPEDDDFSDFHLGYTRTSEGIVRTGVIAYKVEHRQAGQILTETAEQSHYDNVACAWAAVRLGYDDYGIWFAGVVLPGVTDADLTLIEATGQVSGEWKYGSMRALQSVNTPGFAVKSSAEIDEKGNVLALVASAHNLSGCEPTPAERIAAFKRAHEEAEAEARFSALRAAWAAKEGV